MGEDIQLFHRMIGAMTRCEWSSFTKTPRGLMVRAARSTTSRSLNDVNLTMTVRSRCWSVAAPVRCALSTRIAATCSTGSFSCSCRALRSASSVSAHVSPGRSFIPSTHVVHVVVDSSQFILNFVHFLFGVCMLFSVEVRSLFYFL